MKRLRKLLLDCALLFGLIVGVVVHVRLGRHRVVVENGRAAAVGEVSIVIADHVDTRAIAAGDWVTSSVRNPWPTDAAVNLSIRRPDGTIEEHECVYLGFMPQLTYVRLLPGGAVECTSVPSLLAL